jgi:hypothetical protein
MGVKKHGDAAVPVGMKALRGKRWVKTRSGWPKNGLNTRIFEVFKGLKT